MAKRQSSRGMTPETAARWAEGIGETLAHLVNRLESLDAERERVRQQLLGLRDKLNDQLAQFRQAVGRPTRGASSPSRGRRGKSAARTKAGGAGRGKRPIRCGVCGTEGHNARGHAKWEASRSRS